MATKSYLQEGGVIVAEWTLTSADPNGDELIVPYHSDMCITMDGTWGTATAAVQGKNHPVVATGTWLPLADLQGNAISKTADSVEQIQEAPYMVRPLLSTPGAGATVVVRIKATRSR